MKKPQTTYQQQQTWQCKVNNLNPIVHKKYLYTSLYNPMTDKQIKKQCNKVRYKQNNDPLFKSKSEVIKYKLPSLKNKCYGNDIVGSSDNIRGNMDQLGVVDKGWHSKQATQALINRSINKFMSNHTNKQKTNKINIDRQKKKASLKKCKYTSHHKNKHFLQKQYEKQFNNIKTWSFSTPTTTQLQVKLSKFHKTLGQLFIKLSECDKQFSYTYNIYLQISTKLHTTHNPHQTIQQYHNDLTYLLHFLNPTQTLAQSLTNFLKLRKNQNHFKFFETKQILLLFHLVIVQLQIYCRNLQQAKQQLLYVQYQSRKIQYNNIIISCYWQMIQIDISLLKYQQADINIRNMIQISIISHRHHLLKYLLQKISILYYYRGNTLMSSYYKNKSQQGLSQFQIQIYYKQYNKREQILRLEQLLFKQANQYKEVVKYKNNAKFQYYIWKEVKIQDQNRRELDSGVNRSRNRDVNRKQQRSVHDNQNYYIRNNSQYQQYNPITNKQTINHNYYQKTNKKDNNSIFSKYKIAKLNTKNRLSQTIQQNINKVIKTHLSMNRSNNKQSKQIRWKKFMHIVYCLVDQFGQMANSIQRQTQ